MKMMKRIAGVLGSALIYISSAGFTSSSFSLAKLQNYYKEYKSTPIEVASSSSIKTYEDYHGITAVGSAQYQYIHNHMTVDQTTGLLYDEDGFIGVALGYNFGDIGTRYYFELDTGITIPVVKADAKAAVDASDGWTANSNGSVLEFVIDSDIATSYFGGTNGLASSGNFNNYEYLKGNIVGIELVSDEKADDGSVVYETKQTASVKSDEDSDHIQVVQGGYSD